MNEIWKDVVGYEGLYKVSNLGNIFSTRSGKNLKPSVNTNGYYIVGLCNKGQKTHKVHQIVACSFLGHIPCGMYKVVDHIDGHRLNNDVNNLRIVSNRENTSSYKNKTSRYVGVSYHKRSKKYQSSIYLNGKSMFIGRFDSEEEAYKAYLSKLP